MAYAEFFEQLLAKPAFYVGNASISRIKAFIDGYHYAHFMSGDSSEEDMYFGFQGFVQERLHVKTSHSWDRIIRFMTASDVAAFEMTKDLWAEYKAQVMADSNKVTG